MPTAPTKVTSMPQWSDNLRFQWSNRQSDDLFTITLLQGKR